MNENTTLANLSQGLVTTQCQTPAVVVASPVVTTTQQICNPANSYVVDPNCLAKANDSQIEFTFFNGTGADQIVWFSALFGETGDFANFDQDPSAVDFPTFTDGSPLVGGGNGGPKLAGFTRMVQIMPILVRSIEVQGDGISSAQSRSRLIIATENLNLENSCENSLRPGICDACPNGSTGEGSTFNKIFNGPFAIGMLASVGYTVLAGEEVEITLNVMARAVPNFVAVASTNGTGTCSF